MKYDFFRVWGIFRKFPVQAKLASQLTRPLQTNASMYGYTIIWIAVKFKSQSFNRWSVPWSASAPWPRTMRTTDPAPTLGPKGARVRGWVPGRRAWPTKTTWTRRGGSSSPSISPSLPKKEAVTAIYICIFAFRARRTKHKCKVVAKWGRTNRNTPPKAFSLGRERPVNI